MIHSLFRGTTLVAVLVSFAMLGIAVSRNIRTENVQFMNGASNAFIEGSIKGYEIVDYVVEAQQGQDMIVSMATDNYANYFNILAPGENEVAFFNGSQNDNQYEGILPKNGEYKIRVYLMRSAARRNEVAMYNLEIIITDGDDTEKVSKSGTSGKQ